jgi:hypothetical protein
VFSIGKGRSLLSLVGPTGAPESAGGSSKPQGAEEGEVGRGGSRLRGGGGTLHVDVGCKNGALAKFRLHFPLSESDRRRLLSEFV